MKVFIPSAGVGSRLAAYTKYRNKALLSVGEKPVISWIIEKFPADTDFVFAVGYKKEILKEYLNLAHSDRSITFVDVDKFDGPGSGLGYTMMKSKKYLQEPFIFIPNDTLILDSNIAIDPSEYGDWFGVYKNVDGKQVDRQHYRCVTSAGNDNHTIAPKGILSEDIYIGLCGIRNFDIFWQAMRSRDAVNEGESFGLNFIEKKKIFYFDDWFDVGNLEAFTRVSTKLKSSDHNLLNKENEAIWLFDDFVIKYHQDKNFIKDRMTRTDYLPAELLPELQSCGDYMFKYEKIPGEVLSLNLDLDLQLNILTTMQDKIWAKSAPDGIDKTMCLESFYKKKTKDRYEYFLKRFQAKDVERKINGILCEDVQSLISKIIWGSVYSNAKLGRFHGDFHPENILINNKDEIKLLDWRQNFGDGMYEFGDVYYDLAKFMHGLIVDHKRVHSNAYSISFLKNGNTAINIDSDLFKMQLYHSYLDWLSEHSYDIPLVKLHTALIFINIAGLHDFPYSDFLFALGQLLLQQEVNCNSPYIRCKVS